MASKLENESAEPHPASEKTPVPLEGVNLGVVPLEDLPKSRWERSWPVIACGAGLFSDGYLNGVRSLGANLARIRRRYHLPLRNISKWMS